MSFQKSLLTATLLAAASLTAVSNANAADATGKFNVNITITSTCAVNAVLGTNDINFGTVIAGAAASAQSATAFTVACSKGTPFIVNLTPSNNSKVGLGAMLGTGGSVPYQLSKTAGGSAWGNEGTTTTEGNGFAGVGTGTATPINHTVYAAVSAAATNVAPGAYTDVVAVKVTY